MPFFTTWHILEAWFNYEYFGLIIYGPLRHGKSTFAIKVLAELYGIIQNPEWKKMLYSGWDNWVKWVQESTQSDWNAWKTWMRFLPEEFFGLVNKVQEEGRQVPCGVWDDAGMWASQYRWGEEFSKRVSDYTNVAATDFASIMFTTPDPRWLLKHIRDLPGGHNGRVIKVTANPYQRDHRELKVYEGWLMPDLKKSGVKPVYIDFYKTTLPNEVFWEYDKVRRGYAKIAKQRIMELLEEVKKKRGEEVADGLKTKIEQEIGISLA